MKLAVLGRQPEISLAELEALYGHKAIVGKNNDTALLDTDQIKISHLGGTQKIAQVVADSPATSWSDIENFLMKRVMDFALFEENDGSSSKRRLGISVHNIEASTRAITGLALKLKKQLQAKTNYKIGIVPNPKAQLSTAQVLHNRLFDPQRGREIVIANVGNRVYYGLTKGVQDIEAYAERDQVRPARDAHVGMLPPKLAQIILNLSIGKNTPTGWILDPFCGSGVILQEALLRGFKAYGTDISPQMVAASEVNIAWLREKFGDLPEFHVETGDATNHSWQGQISAVASEVDLGEPLLGQPTSAQLEKLVETNYDLMKNSLQNLASLVAVDTSLCLAIPAWRTNRGFISAPLVDDLKKLGYTQPKFKHVISDKLIYARPGQFTGRKLLVIKRA